MDWIATDEGVHFVSCVCTMCDVRVLNPERDGIGFLLQVEFYKHKKSLDSLFNGNVLDLFGT